LFFFNSNNKGLVKHIDLIINNKFNTNPFCSFLSTKNEGRSSESYSIESQPGSGSSSESNSELESSIISLDKECMDPCPDPKCLTYKDEKTGCLACECSLRGRKKCEHLVQDGCGACGIGLADVGGIYCQVCICNKTHL
jgi:hypothetical protein